MGVDVSFRFFASCDTDADAGLETSSLELGDLRFSREELTEWCGASVLVALCCFCRLTGVPVRRAYARRLLGGDTWP